MTILNFFLEHKAKDEYKEKPVLIVETVLAIGLAASMMIFASTTEAKGEVFEIKFHKKMPVPNW